MIGIDDFKKCEIRIGTILSAEKVPEADRLVKLSIDLGLKLSNESSPKHFQGENVLREERDIRQILSGIAEFFPDISALVGCQVPVLTNLAPRIIRGFESNGMVLYAVGTNFLTTLSPPIKILNGTEVK